MSNDEGIESIFTCSEFNYIHNYFGNYRNINELKPILKKSLGGALRSKVETYRDKDIVSNHFFQLELASFLAERNFKIEGLNDINFLIDKLRIITQCRRPFLENNMEDNILNAYSQLNKITKGNEKGIIAIAVDKILLIDNKILDCENLTDVIREENKRINDIINKFSYIWKKFININIIGVFLFVKFKFKPWDGSITLRRGLHTIPLYPNSAENRILIEEIGKRLKMPIIINDFILPDFSSRRKQGHLFLLTLLLQDDRRRLNQVNNSVIFSGKPIGTEEFLNQMVETLDITVDRRPKRRPLKRES